MWVPLQVLENRVWKVEASPKRHSVILIAGRAWFWGGLGRATSQRLARGMEGAELKWKLSCFCKWVGRPSSLLSQVDCREGKKGVMAPTVVCDFPGTEPLAEEEFSSLLLTG